MVSLFTSDSLGGSCLTRGLFDLRAVGTGSLCAADLTFRFFAFRFFASTGESELGKEASVGSGAEAGSALLGCIAWRRCPPRGAPDRVDRVCGVGRTGRAVGSRLPGTITVLRHSSRCSTGACQCGG